MALKTWYNKLFYWLSSEAGVYISQPLLDLPWGLTVCPSPLGSDVEFADLCKNSDFSWLVSSGCDFAGISLRCKTEVLAAQSH